MDEMTDLDDVLDNINQLLEDMEDSISETAQKTKSIFKTPTCGQQFRKETIKENQAPVIHHEFTNKSTGTLEDFDSASVIAYDNASHFDELLKAKDAFESTQTKYNYRKYSIRDSSGNRLCYSAENSPILSRSMIGKGKYQRTNTITPRLVLQNIDKFEVTVKCPDGNLFKAGIFKAWTSFQLAWKIAHVRGMAEKIALVIEEDITDLHLRRQIEDHEIIHKVTTNWAPDSNNILVMSERLTKYDIFNEPADYLPVEMLDTNGIQEPLKTPNDMRRSSLLRSIMTADKTPNLQGWVYLKDFNKEKWVKRFLRLQNSTLYTSETDKTDNETSLTTIYTCDDCYLYNCLPEFKEAHQAPLDHCFCIIPKVVSSWKEIKCFCTTSERFITGWTSGFRFAKYGQQLYTNFREAMGKEANLRRTNSARVSLLYRRSLDGHLGTKENKATIDFSGENGRIISDPLEALRIQSELAFEIPKSSKQRLGTFATTCGKNNTLERKSWYHGKLEREHAIKRLKKHGAKEGLFLVRESNSSHGKLVLSVINKKGNINHLQIFQNKDLYGIEHGPQFNSLDLLIDAYHGGTVEGAEFNLKKPCPIA